MMWLLFAVLSLCAYASADLLGKKTMDSGNVTAPLEMLICAGTLAFLLGFVSYASGAGESGLAPWELLMKNPLIFANLFCAFAYWFLFLFSMRYVGLSIDEAFSGTTGIIYFAGLIFINLFSGQLAAVQDMLHPLRLIPILFVLIFAVLLPNVEIMAYKFSGIAQDKEKKDRRKTVIGLMILLSALIFDAGETLITTFILDSGKIGPKDYMTTNYTAMIIPVIFFSLYLRLRNGRFYIPFKDSTKSAGVYACASVLSSLLYIFASSFDAVRTGIIFIAEPVVPLIGARLFLKEKYTWRQNVCIWTITIAAIAFCIIDNILKPGENHL